MHEPYSEAWLRLPGGYVAAVCSRMDVLTWWNDPFDPRDATVVLAGGVALVWDEESGWRRGRFVSGRQGTRTVLTGVRHLGGGVLPAPDRVAELAAGPGLAERPVYRRYTDHGDGLDEELARWVSALAAAAGSR
ncbi:DUF6292 family protein [Nonomuraea sp. NBC_01738]|uniref:DUF6292 family protein n=1 Tax=Nonomuraea sp. NBC_01738 TaxID=2976003 RepID=UPI002E0D5DF5|nr:DUF6292 family protein [Nonomuraea sp. NBC_01738]